MATTLISSVPSNGVAYAPPYFSAIRVAARTTQPEGLRGVSASTEGMAFPIQLTRSSIDQDGTERWEGPTSQLPSIAFTVGLHNLQVTLNETGGGDGYIIKYTIVDAPPPIDPPLAGHGQLNVRAVDQNGNNIVASVNISGYGSYNTPFDLDVDAPPSPDAATYTLTCATADVPQQTVTVSEIQQVPVLFNLTITGDGGDGGGGIDLLPILLIGGGIAVIGITLLLMRKKG